MFWISFLIVVSALGPSALGSLALGSDDELGYQFRGTHYEGLRAREVGGERIVALSLVPKGARPQPLPRDSLRIQFCLQSLGRKPMPVVQEAVPAGYYLFDHPTLSKLRIGINTFTWSRAVVDATGLADSTLHVLVPLDYSEAGNVLALAPAVFGQAIPDTIASYRFTFATHDDCSLGFSVIDTAGAATKCDPPEAELIAGEVSFVEWPAPSRDGRYRLWLQGYSHEDNRPIDQLVEFHHAFLPRRESETSR